MTIERYSYLKASLPDWADMSKLDKGVSICLVVAIMAALGSLGYVIASPKQGENFTEFYILSTKGKAEDYPRQVILGEPVELIIGVVNHEHQTASYRVDMAIDGIKNSQIDIGTLDNEQKCEREVRFVPQIAGKKQKVEFYLYKNEEIKPCLATPLHLYIDVVTFYVLTAEAGPGDYPQKVKQGEPVELIVGVVSDELQPTSYRMKIKTDGAVYKEITTGILAYREKWQEKISFVPWLQKEKQKIDFWLYRGDELEPCFETPVSLDISVALYPRYVIAKLPGGDRFTEFYVLNAYGKMDYYPWQVKLGEPIEVIAGIVNHEYEITNYIVEIKIDGVCVKVVSIKTLAHRDKWEQKVSFVSWMWGDRKKIEFRLYKNGSAEPYYKEPLYFYVDVVWPYIHDGLPVILTPEL